MDILRLFNAFFDRVVRHVNENGIREVVKLADERDENERLNEYFTQIIPR